MASIKDIATRTGLSIATISRVFNNSPLVSEKAKKKVLAAAEDLDYRPNISAAALRSGKSRIIGVVIPELNNHFFSEIINGVEKRIKELGYNIIISQTHESSEQEKQILESFMQLNVDGVLISLAKETTDLTAIKKMLAQDLPVIFFDRKPPLENIDSVVLDDYKGAQMATQHLIDQGCKHLIHIMGDKQVSIFNDRRKGFEDTLEMNKMEMHPHQVIELSNDRQINTLMLKELLKKFPDIDGFFAHGDFYGLYVIDILKSMNIKVPQQIKVVGFGNTDFTEHLDPSMTSIDQNCQLMGQTSAEVIMEKIKDKQTAIQQRTLTPQLVIRTSSDK